VFGFAKVRYRGLKKNTHRLLVTCALANLFMARRQLLRARGVMCPQPGQRPCSSPNTASTRPNKPVFVASEQIALLYIQTPPLIQTFLNSVESTFLALSL